MSDRQETLQALLSGGRQSEDEIKAFALESFAKEIDYRNQTELLTKLILDYSAITKRLELVNKDLASSRAALTEAQEIARLGRWDVEPTEGGMRWSGSMYSILELDRRTRASSELFLSFVHPDDLETVTDMFRDMPNRQQPWSARYRLRMQDGRIKWVHMRFHANRDDDGRYTHYYGTIQDVTELKKVEDELERHSRELERMVEEKVREISSSQLATIYALIKLSESRDDDTGAHIERTAGFCRLLAQRARELPAYAAAISDSFIDTIYKASPLHDIGKVGIPDSILLKPGKLTDEEFAVMKTHVQIGYDTLSKAGQQYDKNDFLNMGKDIALYHHEKWDGSGYVKGLRGEEIPLAARIMALSDVYDALRSKRVYKEAYSHEKCVEIICESRGSHFDPQLIDVFVRHHEEFRTLYDSVH